MIRALLGIFLLWAAASAGNHIQIIYPKAGQRLPLVDSTFIFGNTQPGAELKINGIRIPVHREGGFLAFLKIDPGNFVFRLVSVIDGDTARDSLSVAVGPPVSGESSPLIKSSLRPAGRTVLGKNDVFEFTLQADRKVQPYCRFSGMKRWSLMYRLADYDTASSVFGRLAESPDGAADYCLYYGCLPMLEAGDSSRVVLTLMAYSDSRPDTAVQTMLDSTDFFVVRLPEDQLRVLRVAERPRIVRVAPGKGYRLVNLPPGVRFLYSGETADFYRVRLAENISGFIRKADAVMEPIGSRPPHGEISSVRVDEFVNCIEISMNVGDRLPYDIKELVGGLELDLFGAVSNIDWIRFNCSSEFLKDLSWSQPQDGILRFQAQLSDPRLWGYSGRYEGNRFILRVRKKPGEFRKGRPLEGIKIAVDPGHSKDSGAIGPTGLAEKDANLWIAEKLSRYLEIKGATVFMTRKGNEDVPLMDRVDFAVANDVDLLVSIHNNALPDGINPFVNNGTSAYYYFPFSRPLAEKIHARIIAETHLPDHGLYYGNLALARISNFPAVLIECAFMMIPEQEAKLKEDKFQKTIAKAIGDGIIDYFSR